MTQYPHRVFAELGIKPGLMVGILKRIAAGG